MMDSLESEEREKKRKLEEMFEGKSTRPSDDAMFLRSEIIDALKKRSDEKNGKLLKENRRKDGKVSAENHGFSRNTAPRDKLIHCENERRRRQIQANQ